MMTLVKDLMQTQVISVSPQDSVSDLVHRLEEAGITGAPVVDGDGQLVGVVSSRDVVRLARELQDVPEAMRWGMSIAGPLRESQFVDPPVEGEFFAYFVTSDGKFVDVRDRIRDVPEDVFSGYSVSDIMSPVPFTIAPGATLPELARLLRERKVHRILVVDDDRLVGIVTTMDILAALAEG